MSTDPAATLVVTLDEPWRLAESVAIRPEPFGALAYDFGTRRLTFLKRPDLVDVVTGLADRESVRAALESAGVPPQDWPQFAKALAALAESGMIERRVDET